MQLFSCVRPLILRNNSEDYPYSVSGTCYLVDYYGRPYIITASHNYQKDAFDVSQLTAQYDVNKSEMIPVCRAFIGNPQGDEDSDKYDFTILQVSAELIDKDKWKASGAISLWQDDGYTLPSPKLNFAFRGYPTEGIEFGFPERNIQTTGVTADAFYEGKLASEHIHTLTVNGDEDFPDFNGFSGAPVFQLVHIDERATVPSFAGMIIRGTKASRLMHLVSNRYIVPKLHEITVRHKIAELFVSDDPQ